MRYMIMSKSACICASSAVLKLCSEPQDQIKNQCQQQRINMRARDVREIRLQLPDRSARNKPAGMYYSLVGSP